MEDPCQDDGNTTLRENFRRTCHVGFTERSYIVIVKIRTQAHLINETVVLASSSSSLVSSGVFVDHVLL